MEVFFSYTHRDEKYRKKVDTHLASLRRQDLISNWSDHEISPGKMLDTEIALHLESAQIILLLISPDFIASDYCYSVELKRAIERHEAGTAWVIPIIARPCDWHSLPFGGLKAAPEDGKAITEWTTQDKACHDIAKKIRAVVTELNAAPVSPSPTSGRSPGTSNSDSHPLASLDMTLASKRESGTSHLNLMHEEKPQFEEKLTVSLRACGAMSSAPPFGTGEPMHLAIELIIRNLGLSPVFIVSAALKDASRTRSIGFEDVCNENEPLQPGGRRKTTRKLLHHDVFPPVSHKYANELRDALKESNRFVFTLLRFICQEGASFYVETGRGNTIVFPAADVCDEGFMGWPFLAVPQDIEEEFRSKSLEDLERKWPKEPDQT